MLQQRGSKAFKAFLSFADKTAHSEPLITNCSTGTLTPPFSHMTLTLQAVVSEWLSQFGVPVKGQHCQNSFVSADEFRFTNLSLTVLSELWPQLLITTILFKSLNYAATFCWAVPHDNTQFCLTAWRNLLFGTVCRCYSFHSVRMIKDRRT